ncbi:DNA polymerase IV [Snodgrassella sp. CFCC 13594]|uniref:DNA polymerase IV n=1 Tax=Snodgrassella sp. CFCC 13594 TaxID=1775559 RepID=UPI000833A1CE|nr:DNA polymerase IV [Snodgrassella sp. CFCC 13594]
MDTQHIRKIIHIDMDAFYASVERRDNPNLLGKPLVVAGTGPRSVVCTASYEARQFGVHSAMAVTTAKRLCPDAIYVPPDFPRYRAVSVQIHTIFARYTSLIEPLSLDEAFLDVTDYAGPLIYAQDIAQHIRASILSETGLTASAGIAPNKFLAKIASDWRKPNGQFVIAPQQVLRFLHHLPVGKIPGVGKVTERKMQDLGWHTVGDLARIERPILVHHFGRWGHRLYDLARGRDERAVQAQRQRQQISQEITLIHDENLAQICLRLPELAERLVVLMQRKRMMGSCVTLKLKTSNFHTLTRSQTFSHPLTEVSALLQAADSLITRMPQTAAEYRLIGLGISHLQAEHNQLDLWSTDSCQP